MKGIFLYIFCFYLSRFFKTKSRLYFVLFLWQIITLDASFKVIFRLYFISVLTQHFMGLPKYTEVEVVSTNSSRQDAVVFL